MSIGQIAEIADDGRCSGWCCARLGWRTTMAVGIAAHAARFFVYAIGDPLWLMVAINVVHGMCYAFFFAAVYIFVDEHFPKDSRASAQGLFNLLILGARAVLRQPAVGMARRRFRSRRWRGRVLAPLPGARGARPGRRPADDGGVSPQTSAAKCREMRILARMSVYLNECCTSSPRRSTPGFGRPLS